MDKTHKIKIAFYIGLGCISITLIGLYWCKCIDCDWRNVLMAVGASLLGAVLLGGIFDLIDLKKKKTNKLIIIGDAVQASEWLLEEIKETEVILSKQTEFNFDCKSLKEFNKEATKQIYELYSKRTKEDDEKAKSIQNTVDDVINTQTFIIARCQYAVSVFQKIVEYKSVLLNTAQLTKTEIDIFDIAATKISRFLNIWNERNYVFIATNDINFVEELDQIVKMKERTIDKCSNCKYKKEYKCK